MILRNMPKNNNNNITIKSLLTKFLYSIMSGCIVVLGWVFIEVRDLPAKYVSEVRFHRGIESLSCDTVQYFTILDKKLDDMSKKNDVDYERLNKRFDNQDIRLGNLRKLILDHMIETSKQKQ